MIILYERRSGQPARFGSHFVGPRKRIEDVVRPNSLFLSAAAANNHQQLTKVYRLIVSNFRVAFAENAYGRLAETLHIYEDHHDDRDFLVDLMLTR